MQSEGVLTGLGVPTCPVLLGFVALVLRPDVIASTPNRSTPVEASTAIEVSPDELLDSVRRASNSGTPPAVEEAESTPLTTPSGLLETQPPREAPDERAERGVSLRRAITLVAVLLAALAVVSFLVMGQ